MRRYLRSLLCALLARHASPPTMIYNGRLYQGYCPRCDRLLGRLPTHSAWFEMSHRHTHKATTHVW